MVFLGTNNIHDCVSTTIFIIYHLGEWTVCSTLLLQSQLLLLNLYRMWLHSLTLSTFQNSFLKIYMYCMLLSGLCTITRKLQKSLMSKLGKFLWFLSTLKSYLIYMNTCSFTFLLLLNIYRQICSVVGGTSNSRHSSGNRN